MANITYSTFKKDIEYTKLTKALFKDFKDCYSEDDCILATLDLDCKDEPHKEFKKMVNTIVKELYKTYKEKKTWINPKQM
jgi:hypothetical protein